jgi:hypothetical protein
MARAGKVSTGGGIGGTTTCIKIGEVLPVKFPSPS